MAVRICQRHGHGEDAKTVPPNSHFEKGDGPAVGTSCWEHIEIRARPKGGLWPFASGPKDSARSERSALSRRSFERNHDLAEVLAALQVMVSGANFGEGENEIHDRLQLVLSDRAVHRFEHIAAADENAIYA